MTKVSIVGVRGSGKTVLMAVLGDKYKLSDENDGLFFRAKDPATLRFVMTQMNELRAGRWPAGTQSDRMQDVNWQLFRRREGDGPELLGDVTMLDFAGEVYAAAFGGATVSSRGDLSAEVAQLQDYVAKSDRLVVLVNIADLCNGMERADDDVMDALWASISILDFAAKKGVKRVAIGLSQYERFRALADECGGPMKTLRKYAPFLYSVCDHLPLFTLTAVDKTVPDANGRDLPARDFSSQGLDKLMDWVLEADGGRGATALPGGGASPSADGRMGLPLYRVIDLATGQETGLDAVPDGGWTDEHKTTKLVMRRIALGTFMMGSPAGEKGRSDDETLHRVTLTNPYYIGVFEVTQRQWKCVMGNVPAARRGPARPVVNVTWNDCQDFCCKVGHGLRLPTEAEWEYACRAGTSKAYSWGKSREGVRGNFRTEVSPKGWTSEKTSEVGSYAPNAWGIYDMHGNVWEWCQDWYAPYRGDAIDPEGGRKGSDRVLRGGSWYSLAADCRSAARSSYAPERRDHDLGFRLCCSAEPSSRCGDKDRDVPTEGAKVEGAQIEGAHEDQVVEIGRGIPESSGAASDKTQADKSSPRRQKCQRRPQSSPGVAPVPSAARTGTEGDAALPTWYVIVYWALVLAGSGGYLSLLSLREGASVSSTLSAVLVGACFVFSGWVFGEFILMIVGCISSSAERKARVFVMLATLLASLLAFLLFRLDSMGVI